MLDWKKFVRERVPRMALPAAREAEVLSELAQLLEDTYDDARREGRLHEDALRYAAQQLPEGRALAAWIEQAEQPVKVHVPQLLRAERIEDSLVQSQRGVIMNNFLQDAKYAMRMLVKSPGFTLVAVLTLALGIGANTAIFTLVNEALLRPRPGIGEPERLADIGRSDRGRGLDNMSYPNFRDYRERNTTMSGMAAMELEPRPMSLGGTDGAERIYAGLVSGTYFEVLQARPHIGRFFLPEEDRTEGTHPVVVLSHAFWQQRFQGDRAIVGREIKLNGLGYTVVGVAAPGFHGTVPLTIDAWIPIMMTAHAMTSPGLVECRRCSFVLAIGRLKPGVPLGAARAESDSISASLEREYPGENRERSVALLPSRLFPGQMTQFVGAFLGLLMAIVGLVLVIASVNVAGMMLVRASTRRREIAVRLAIGAGRSHIVRQFVAEGLLVFLAGGAIGLLFAVWMRNALLSLLPALPMPVTFDLSMDWRVLTFALAVSLLAGVTASLLPALQASRPDLLTALKDDSNASGPRKLRLRNALVLAQVALSLVLLICAGLFLRALGKATTINPGFDMNGLHVVSMDLSLAGFRDADGTDFANRFLERARALPGVTSASWAWSVPLDGGGRGLGGFEAPGTTPPHGNDSWEFDWSVVTPGYFATMKIPLVQGRDFTEADTRGNARVAIINETAARNIWPGQDAVGKIFRHHNSPDPVGHVQIIGIARDQKYRSLGDRERNFVFVPLRQQYISKLGLMVRTPNAAAAIPAIRATLREMNPNLPILNVLSMNEYAALSLFPQKVASWVSGTLGAVGLLLVGLGIYGVTAFSVEQRTREIGIRMALGAERRDVLRMVLRQGLRLAMWGVGIGLLLSAGLSHLLASLLYGLSALDPVTFGGVAAMVISVAAFATLIPARRATRVDLLVALRHE